MARKSTSRKRTRVGPEQWREAFRLYCRQDRSLDEIAAAVGATHSNLQKRIQIDQWRVKRKELLEEIHRRERELLVEELAGFEADRVRSFMHLVDVSAPKLLERILTGQHDLTPFDLVAMSRHLSEIQTTPAASSLPPMIFETSEPSEFSTTHSIPKRSSDSKPGTRRRVGSPYPANKEPS